MTPKFETGAAVRWTSQSQGSTKEKIGTVHAVVPAGESPIDYLAERYSSAQIKFDKLISTTSYVRYLIAVPRGGRSVKVDYYCPRPALLRVADPE